MDQKKFFFASGLEVLCDFCNIFILLNDAFSLFHLLSYCCCLMLSRARSPGPVAQQRVLGCFHF